MKLHRKLRARMLEYGLDLEHMARVIGRGRTAASHRLNAREPWDLDEVYKLCDALNIPYEDMPHFFPPGGKEIKAIEPLRPGTGKWRLAGAERRKQDAL